MEPTKAVAEPCKTTKPPLVFDRAVECALSGSALLQDPYFNQGSAFSARDRQAFKLTGLLPASIQTLEQQTQRAYGQYSSRDGDLAKNAFLNSIKLQNIVLYYRLLLDHLAEMFSIIYTPTEGAAIEQYSHIFRKPEGCFLNINEQDQIFDHLAQWGEPEDIDYVVVTDAQEILGIGDQGVGGIFISTAKLALCTLCAGLHPNRTLPVVLDCGTDRQDLLEDDLYLGVRQRRVSDGPEYDSFVDTFVQSINKLYPKAIIHFEDFGLTNARRLLNRYASERPVFNDDVQGTGCITLAAIMAGQHINKQSLKDLRLVTFGFGSAGAGIADQVRDAIATECKISPEEASRQILAVDKPGLLLQSMGEKLTDGQRTFAIRDEDWKGQGTDLLAVIREFRPNVLIGCSTKPGAFTEEIVREMAKHCERPIILPLSNPTRLIEAKPEDIIKWTDGKALVATGSPFKPVQYKDKQVVISECNNSTAFPGIALAAVLSQTSQISTPLLVAAVHALASSGRASRSSNTDGHEGLLPDISEVRELSVRIAVAVIKEAVSQGLARREGIPWTSGSEDQRPLEEWVRAQMWRPEYRELVRVGPKEARREAMGEIGVGSARRLAREVE